MTLPPARPQPRRPHFRFLPPGLWLLWGPHGSGALRHPSFCAGPGSRTASSGLSHVGVGLRRPSRSTFRRADGPRRVDPPLGSRTVRWPPPLSWCAVSVPAFPSCGDTPSRRGGQCGDPLLNVLFSTAAAPFHNPAFFVFFYQRMLFVLNNALATSHKF